MKNALLRELCKELRLGSAILEGYEDIRAQTHEEFLIELLQRMVQTRNVQRRERNICSAGFEVITELEDYDYSTLTLPAGVNREYLES